MPNKIDAALAGVGSWEVVRKAILENFAVDKEQIDRLDDCLLTIKQHFDYASDRKPLLIAFACLLNSEILQYKSLFRQCDSYGLDREIISDLPHRQLLASLLS